MTIKGLYEVLIVARDTEPAGTLARIVFNTMLSNLVTMEQQDPNLGATSSPAFVIYLLGCANKEEACPGATGEVVLAARRGFARVADLMQERLDRLMAARAAAGLAPPADPDAPISLLM